MPRWTIEDTLALYDEGIIPGRGQTGKPSLPAPRYCEHCGIALTRSSTCFCPLGLRDHYERMEERSRDWGDLSAALYWSKLFREAWHDRSISLHGVGGIRVS